MKKSKNLQATSLRLILIGCLLAIIILGGFGFSYWADILRDDAIEVSKKQAEAVSSQSDVQTLQRIQTELERNKDVVERASSIVAESQSYQYQNQIIEDITDYATRSGIEITNINFTSTTAATPTTGQPQPPTAPPPSGVKTTSASITIKNPVDYTNLLRFIYSIEQNLTKMQISRVGLSREASGGITSDALTIEVYVR